MEEYPALQRILGAAASEGAAGASSSGGGAASSSEVRPGAEGSGAAGEEGRGAEGGGSEVRPGAEASSGAAGEEGGEAEGGGSEVRPGAQGLTRTQRRNKRKRAQNELMREDPAHPSRDPDEVIPSRSFRAAKAKMRAHAKSIGAYHGDVAAVLAPSLAGAQSSRAERRNLARQAEQWRADPSVAPPNEDPDL